MKVRPVLKWNDLYVGFFWDPKTTTLYWLIIPMVGLKFIFFGKRKSPYEWSGQQGWNDIYAGDRK
jgi:hypothetical protein